MVGIAFLRYVKWRNNGKLKQTALYKETSEYIGSELWGVWDTQKKQFINGIAEKTKRDALYWLSTKVGYSCYSYPYKMREIPIFAQNIVLIERIKRKQIVCKEIKYLKRRLAEHG